MNQKPHFMATGIGSMPFTDAAPAVDAAMTFFPSAPFWPQLPQRSLLEQMEIQYSRGMPCAVMDREKKRLYFDTERDYSEDFGRFYETYMRIAEGDAGEEAYASSVITPEYGAGLYRFAERIGSTQTKYPYVKVQTTGPCSFALTVTDEKKRAIYYNEEFRDMIVKALSLKCRWQILKFQPYAEKIICFIDEPILSAFGSSTYVSVKREDVISLLREVVDAIHTDNALAGIHCCGNTDWGMLVESGVDIVNFDAFSYGHTIALYPTAVKRHLEDGGMLAWGIVPTSKIIKEKTVGELVSMLENTMDTLAQKDIDKQTIAAAAIITPSCGTGSMNTEDALLVFEKTAQLSVAMKERYFLPRE